MRPPLFLLLVLVGSYAIAWVLLYAWIQEGDFSQIWIYLRLSWTGGLERVAFIQMGAVILAFASTLAAATVLLVRRLIDRSHARRQ